MFKNLGHFFGHGWLKKDVSWWIVIIATVLDSATPQDPITINQQDFEHCSSRLEWSSTLCLASRQLINTACTAGARVGNVFHCDLVAKAISDLSTSRQWQQQDLWTYHLVGGAITILKHMSSSMGRIIPYMTWKIKHVPNHQPVMIGRYVLGPNIHAGCECKVVMVFSPTKMVM